MAKCKFKAAQFYKVSKGESVIVFNYFGEYETDKPEELEILHKMAPYVVEVEHFEKKAPKASKPEPKVEEKAEEKAEEKKSKQTSKK